MNTLTIIRHTLRKMSKEELRISRCFLEALQTSNTRESNKAVKLFELLEREIGSNELLTDRELENLVYGKKSDTAFPRLLLRLKDKIFESLLLNVNLERTGAYSERGKALHLIRKNISLAQILYNRGQTDYAYSLVRDCVLSSYKLEHYEECLTALRVAMQWQSLQNNQKDFQDFQDKYPKVLAALNGLRSAQYYYSLLIQEVEYKAQPMPLEKLDDIISELSQIHRETGSYNVALFLTYFEAHYYQTQGRYLQAAEVLKRQEEIVEISPALYTPHRLALSTINRSWNYIYLMKFKQALNCIEKVKNSVARDNVNYYQLIQNEFYIHYYSNRIDKALIALDELDSHDDNFKDGFRQGKRNYFRACVLFTQSRFDEAKQILLLNNPIDSDREGWSLYVRLLLVMVHIELGDFQKAFLDIENLRKQIDKMKKGQVNIDRISKIYDLLRGLSNCRFDFVQARKKKPDEYNLLAQKNEYGWRILTPELIAFDQWFMAKTLKNRYKLVLPVYTELQPVRG